MDSLASPWRIDPKKARVTVVFELGRPSMPPGEQGLVRPHRTAETGTHLRGDGYHASTRPERPSEFSPPAATNRSPPFGYLRREVRRAAPHRDVGLARTSPGARPRPVLHHQHVGACGSGDTSASARLVSSDGRDDAGAHSPWRAHPPTGNQRRTGQTSGAARPPPRRAFIRSARHRTWAVPALSPRR